MFTDHPFLGKGWSFPPIFRKDHAAVEMTAGVTDIERSLEILFTTTLGERLMNPSYGCNLKDMLFEPMNTSNIGYIENLLKTAILYHEPRIDADQIDVQPDAAEGVLWIHIQFAVRNSNSRFNFVYPFYLNQPGV